jgi:3-hydroxyisobutyrate dehydrogenase
VAYDVSQDAVRAVLEGGAQEAKSVAEVVRQVDVLFTSLPGPAQLEQVVFGPGGVMETMPRGFVLFDLSTSSLSLARRMHADFRGREAWMLDAPVSGGPAGAATGDLAIWVGGEREIFDRHVDLLRAMAQQPHYVGGIGAGTITKLSHNMVGYMIMLSLAETFSMAVKAGVDPLELWQALKLGVVGKQSPLNLLTKQFLPGKYEPPAFALELAHKDMTLGTRVAEELGVPMALARLTLKDMTEALGRGYGSQDSRAFLQLQLERAGVTIAVEPDRLERVLNAAPQPAKDRGAR